MITRGLVILLFAAGLAVQPEVCAAELFRVKVEDPQVSVRLLQGGARLLADYGAFQLLEIDQTNSEVGRAALTIGASSVTDDRKIFLNAGTIDTRRAGSVFSIADGRDSQERRLHLIQFIGPIKPDWLASVLATGAQLGSYLPENAYLIYGTPSQIQKIRATPGLTAFLQWDGAYLESHKLHPEIQKRARLKRPQVKDSSDLFAIQLIQDEVANGVTRDRIESVAPRAIIRDDKTLRFRNIIARLDPEELRAIARRPDVISIHAYAPPKLNDERQAQIMAGSLEGDLPAGPGYLAFLNSKGFNQTVFSASNFAVDISDSGVDNASLHPNHLGLFIGSAPTNPARVAYSRLEGFPNTGSTLQGRDGHGTLNAHIIGGHNAATGFPSADASGYRFGLGIAPFVRMGSSVIFDADQFTHPNFANLTGRAWRDGARISSNSWNSDAAGAYNIDAQAYDALVRDAAPDGSAAAVASNQEIVMLFSAGNHGPNANTIGSPGTAKNVITVGAAESVQGLGGSDGCEIPDSEADNASDIAAFSSRGPTDDGRCKPDLLAPGTHVSGGLWQGPNPAANGTAAEAFDGSRVCGVPDGLFFPPAQQLYTVSSGTSHSSAAVAGAAALLRQDFINKGLQAPSPALTKAALAATSRYMTGAGGNDALPSSAQGMGSVHLGSLFNSTPRYHRDQKSLDKFNATGQVRTYNVGIADPSKPSRIVLAWTDAPGSTAGNAYNNNLDLTVVAGGKIYRGNVFTGATSAEGGAADARNNLESVFLPEGLTGSMSIVVTAANINSDGVPSDADALDQDFALFAYNATGPTAADIVAGGAILSGENFTPPNGLADSAETVSVQLPLRNLGTISSGSIVATLLSSGNVTSPSGPQSYGVIGANSSSARPFSFTVNGSANTSSGITATLALTSDGLPIGSVTYDLRVGRPASIAPASAVRLIAEAFTPANNRPDLGEIVSVQLTLRNIGDRPFNNLIGDLAASTPVTAPTAAQSFGALVPGQAATRTFSFRVSGEPGATYPVILNLRDGQTPYPAVSFPDFRIAKAAAVVLETTVLTSESAQPANGWPDFGEVVTAAVTLRNTGETAFQALSAQLQSTSGVQAPLPAGSQPFGMLPGGASATRQFIFTGGLACGAEVRAAILVSEAGTAWSTLDHLWFLGTTRVDTFSTDTPITIPQVGPSDPYPSVINVAGLLGNVISARATLKNFGHGWPDDVDVLLLGPSGEKTILMSDVGGGESTSGVSITFDDAASVWLPDESLLSTGTFRPTDHVGADTDAFSHPAPTGPHPATLSIFRGAPANGAWNLYVKDSFVGDSGGIDGAWELRLETATGTGCQNIIVDASAAIANLPGVLAVNQPRTVAFNVVNPSAQPASGVALTCQLPPGVTYNSARTLLGTVAHDPGTNTVTFDIGYLAANSSALLMIELIPVSIGARNILATLSLLQTDPATTNNHPSIALNVDADTDGDGLPDSYENANGLVFNNPTDALSDKDGDGANNRSEYLAGTAVENASSVLRINSIARSTAGVTIVFPSVVGRLYRIERRSDLRLASWSPVAGEILAKSNTTSVMDAAAPTFTRAFYRVVLVP